MKLFIRKDGRFDIEVNNQMQLALDKLTAARILREYKVSRKEFEIALEVKTPGDNVLHFGDLNKRFMFSTFESETINEESKLPVKYYN